MSGLDDWLKNVQATELTRDDLIDPARAKQPVGQIVKGAGGGATFDTEPAAFYKLLRDIAPTQKDT